MPVPYASDPDRSRGRRHDEPGSAFRSPFQRDRDRIIHSSAFRRLKHKTQVFVEHEGDYFRTRLTHSIEVAQVARTIAKHLGLNVELAEAVALAHDLGHPPFGHTGEEALARLMAPHGGFDHNAQAIRIVTSLERHYAEWDGLNLTWETLEGIAKHNGPVAPLREGGPVAPPREGGPVAPLREDGPVAPLRGDGPAGPRGGGAVAAPGGDGPGPPEAGGGPAHGPVPYALAEYDAVHDLALHTHASAEAQVAALADDIAYNNHDLHDGLRAELFSTAELAELPVLGPCFAAVDARYPGLDLYRRRHEALRRFFGVLVEDVIAVTEANLRELAPATPDDVRHAGRMMARFSPALWADLSVIRRFLFERMYRAPAVVEMRAQVTQVVDELFPRLMENPADLPRQWRRDVDAAQDETALARIVCDYVAGMTDRFALQTHDRLVGPGR